MFKFKIKSLKKFTKLIPSIFELPSLPTLSKRKVVNNNTVIHNNKPAQTRVTLIPEPPIDIPSKEYLEAKFNMLNKSILIGLIASTIVICIFCAVMFMYVAPSFCKALFYGISVR